MKYFKILTITFFLLIPNFVSAYEIDSVPFMFLNHHSKNTESVAFAPNGKYFATSGQDKIIKIYKIDSGFLPSFQTEINYHKAAVTKLQFNKDGSFLLSAGKDFQTNIWQVDSTILKHNLQSGFYPVNSAGMDMIPRVVYSVADDNKLRIYDLVDAKRNREVILQENPTSVVLSHNRQNFFVGTKSGKILVLDFFGRQQRVIEAHTGNVNSLDISLDGKLLISAGDDKKAIIWNIASGKVLHELNGHNWKVNVAKFSFRGGYAVTGTNDGFVYIWEIEKGQIVKAFKNVGSNVRDIDFSNDLEKIIVASHDKSKSGIWIYETGIKLPQAPGVRRVATSRPSEI